MERFPAELLYVLVFLGIILFNVVQALRRRHQEAQAEAEPAEAAAAEPAPLEDIWGRRPVAPAPLAPSYTAPPPAAPSVSTDVHRRRRPHPLQALLRNKRNLHHAIVLMTVLGPCRAKDPPGR